MTTRHTSPGPTISLPLIIARERCGDGRARHKNASSARDDYALQQSVIASLSQHALLGGSLQQLFDDATRRARETLGVSHSTLLELRSDHETLAGTAGSGWDADVVRTIVAEAGARSHAGYALLVDAPVIVTDFSRERRLRSSIAERWGLKSGVTVVIHGRERPLACSPSTTRSRAISAMTR